MTHRQAARNPHGLFSIEGECLRPRAFSRLDLAELHSDYQVEDVGLVDETLAGKGVRLRKLIDLVGPEPGAGWLTVESADGSFSATLPLHETGRTAMIVYEKDGQPLAREDGGPARFVIPYFADRCANVKAVGKLIVTRSPGRDTRPSGKAGSQASAT